MLPVFSLQYLQWARQPGVAPSETHLLSSCTTLVLSIAAPAIHMHVPEMCMFTPLADMNVEFRLHARNFTAVLCTIVASLSGFVSSQM